MFRHCSDRSSLTISAATETAGVRGSNSIEAQRERAAAYIESRRSEGLEIHPECYDDRGYSGANVDRPALQRLLRNAKAAKFKMVVVCDIARLTRSLADLLSIVEVLDDAGVSLATVTEDLNTSTPRGRMTLTFLLNTSRHSLRKSS